MSTLYTGSRVGSRTVGAGSIAESGLTGNSPKRRRVEWNEMAGPNDDHALVQRSRAGDREAFGQLVVRYEQRLFATLVRLTGSNDSAQDVLQDAFVQAYVKLDGFQGQSSFYTWIYRIAVNRALSDRRKRREVVPLDASDGSTTRLEPAEDPERADPMRPLVASERNQMIQAALDRLSPEHRAVVVLKDLDGKSYDEIAAILDINIGTVRSRLHRARSELKRRLAPLLDENALSPPTPDEAIS